ncbi:MAG: arylsulfatase, partial [Draconibacterium sp.]|nr:arylsulfatase [Draconibacterium sp.]
MKTLSCFIILSLTLLFSCQTKPKKDITLSEVKGKPNIIFILADDLGYGDISCQGQTKFQTPNIDRLATEGMTFTQHYAGSTVCSPSRSVLLTGQHTGHTPIRGNKRDGDKGNWPLAGEALTVAKILQQNGYVTGAFGKWGLGYPGSEGDPNNQGFNEFYGYNDQTLAHNYYPQFLNHNQDTVWLTDNDNRETGTYAPIPIHEQALKFIEDNKDKPFFMYYPSVIPHAELFAPEEYKEKYRGKFLPEKEYKGYDEGPRYRKGPYGSQPESHAAFAAMVDLLDVQVGEILDKLKELGIDNNTIIMFSSDNGPHLEGGADPDYFDSNGPYQGYKRDLYEGGIRVPMFIRWPEKVKAGSTSGHISAF